MILVADSMTDSRDLLCRLLERDGHRCVPTAMGRETIWYASSFPCDAVVTDVDLADMPSLSLLELLGANAKTAVIPVVVYASGDASAAIARAKELGAFAWLPRGEGTANQLRDAVYRAVARRRG